MIQWLRKERHVHRNTGSCIHVSEEGSQGAAESWHVRIHIRILQASTEQAYSSSEQKCFSSWASFFICFFVSQFKYEVPPGSHMSKYRVPGGGAILGGHRNFRKWGQARGSSYLRGEQVLSQAPFLFCSLDTLSIIGVESPPPYVPAPLRSVHACKSCDHRQILQNHEQKQLSAPISCFWQVL